MTFPRGPSLVPPLKNINSNYSINPTNIITLLIFCLLYLYEKRLWLNKDYLWQPNRKLLKSSSCLGLITCIDTKHSSNLISFWSIMHTVSWTVDICIPEMWVRICWNSERISATLKSLSSLYLSPLSSFSLFKKFRQRKRTEDKERGEGF